MSQSNLLHPELFDLIPLTGKLTAERLSAQVGKVSARASSYLPCVSIVVRTLNEADTLESLFEDVTQQRYSTEPEIIVLDNESTDRTVEVAESYGAQVVTISRDEFTYARSLNRAMEVASNPVVFSTVGHALLSNRQTLVAAGLHLLKRDNVGVFARTLPGPNASIPERIVAVGNFGYIKSAHKSKVARPAVANLGLFAAQNIALRKDAWQELGGFSEEWESGGEDTDFAIRAINSGGHIIEDQVVAVHHTHGLSLCNYAKQWLHWARTLNGPRELDMAALAARRPDLDFS